MTNNTLGPSKQILNADGHQDTCSLVSYLLKPFGYKVTTVNDMSNGLRIARGELYHANGAYGTSQDVDGWSQ